MHLHANITRCMVRSIFSLFRIRCRCKYICSNENSRKTWLQRFILFSRTRVWPLSLLALRQITKNLQLNRDHRDSESVLRCSRAKGTECDSGDLILEDNNGRMTRDTLVALRKHDNHFLKHVKIKKRHEIQQMAQVYLNGI